MNEPREHSPRQIYIRNHLYIVFEEMANEIGCTIDYLVNEAMRTYARAHHNSNALDESIIPPISSGPPPLPPSTQQSHFAPAGSRPLYLWFNQQRYVIDQPRFIIGRGGQNKHCDLVIPDSNISRNHCVITYRNGEHHIRDLNSTNGIEFNGAKVRQKRIEEGEKFYLCDYPLVFTYEPHRMVGSQ
jgi:hypothetical protein